MPKLDLDAIAQINVDRLSVALSRRRWRSAITASSPGRPGSSDFGVSHVVLEPGGISSQRHWHEGEDEFVVMLDGEAVLVEEEGETVMRAGDCAAFPRASPNGHQLVNRSDRACVVRRDRQAAR